MEKEEIQAKLEQIKNYIENLNFSEIGEEGNYSDEEIFGRNISDLFEDDENQENLNEEVRRMVDNAMDFVNRWYEEEFSTYKDITLEEMLGNSESAKEMKDYMFETGQEDEFTEDKIDNKKNLDDLSTKDLEKMLKEEIKGNNSKKQKLEEIKRSKLIDKIKQAQQEGRVLDAELIQVQDKAKDK